MSFHQLGIAPQLLTLLDKLGFTVPTPIQKQSIPVAIQGKDIMGIAQTGTGKTLAFGVPMVQLLAQKKGNHGLVLLPTRELALQVEQALETLASPLGLKTTVLIGGESMSPQLRSLRAHPDIIIATPGRLIDHLERKSLSLSRVAILVLDEADHMLDMGFAPQLKRIMEQVPKNRQTLLFSATMPPEIVRIATQYMATPVRVEVTLPGTAAQSITQELFFVAHMEKLSLLEKLLSEYTGSVLVFTRTKHGAKRIALSLRNKGHSAAEIHSNRSQSQRQEALSGFRVGRYRVLVATDIAARGIDVSGIELVINYDLPEKAEDYVHRIGRTARAGKEGRAISFAMPDQRGNVKDIERLIRLTLPIIGHVGVTPFVLGTPTASHHRPARRRTGFHSRRRR
ncbi:MAG: DEAD/DEAH box helicase [Candidatus Zixiibacteriota bacterium]